MPRVSSLSVEGLDGLAEQFKRMADPTQQENALRKAAASGVSVFKQEIQSKTPVDHGYLKQSVSVAFIKEESVTGKVATYETVFMGTAPDFSNLKTGKLYRGMRNADVARWLEFGTSKMASKAFVRPAFDSQKQAAVDAAATKFREVLLDGKQ